MSQARQRLVRLLEAVAERDYVSPGDLVVATGMPRYLVLAFIQCMEALGVLEPVYVKGSHKVYSVTPLAQRLLEALETNSVEKLLSVGVAAVEASSSPAGSRASAEQATA